MHLGHNDNFDSAAGDAGQRASRAFPPARPQLAELFCDFRDGAAAGFALAQIAQGGRQVLWLQERMVALETGRPFGHGCERFGCGADRLVLACARNAGDLLWAMEEGLRCGSLAAIIGEAWANPRALDFTASKRLAIRAERQGVPVFLLRYNAVPDLSAARRRWRVRALPSMPHPHDAKAPGAPCWEAELLRARDARPGTWQVRYDRAAHRLDPLPPLRDPAVEGETAGGARGHAATAAIPIRGTARGG